jgi:hypothetical protein
VKRALVIGLPVAMVVGAFVLVVVVGGREGQGAGYTLLGSAALLVLSIFIFRAGLASNADRDREEEAREFYDRHGRWPYRGELEAAERGKE